MNKKKNPDQKPQQDETGAIPEQELGEITGGATIYKDRNDPTSKPGFRFPPSRRPNRNPWTPE